MNSFRANQCEIDEPVSGAEVMPAPLVDSHFSTWNGGVTDKYRWSQSSSDLTVELALPHLFSKKDLTVSISSLKLRVCVQSSVVLEGDFFAKTRYVY